MGSAAAALWRFAAIFPDSGQTLLSGEKLGKIAEPSNGWKGSGPFPCDLFEKLFRGWTVLARGVRRRACGLADPASGSWSDAGLEAACVPTNGLPRGPANGPALVHLNIRPFPDQAFGGEVARSASSVTNAPEMVKVGRQDGGNCLDGPESLLVCRSRKSGHGLGWLGRSLFSSAFLARSRRGIRPWPSSRSGTSSPCR